MVGPSQRGRADVIVKEFREKFVRMNSVLLDNSIEEFYGGSKQLELKSLGKGRFSLPTDRTVTLSLIHS